MPKKVSASEAKTKFGSIVGWTVDNKDEVIVESRGHPKAVIMAFEEYQELMGLRQKSLRQQALAELEALRDKVQARNQDLDEQGAQSLADRFTREVFSDMVKEGKITYQG